MSAKAPTLIHVRSVDGNGTKFCYHEFENLWGLIQKSHVIRKTASKSVAVSTQETLSSNLATSHLRNSMTFINFKRVWAKKLRTMWSGQVRRWQAFKVTINKSTGYQWLTNDRVLNTLEGYLGNGSLESSQTTIFKATCNKWLAPCVDGKNE